MDVCTLFGAVLISARPVHLAGLIGLVCLLYKSSWPIRLLHSISLLRLPNCSSLRHTSIPIDRRSVRASESERTRSASFKLQLPLSRAHKAFELLYGRARNFVVVVVVGPRISFKTTTTTTTRLPSSPPRLPPPFASYKPARPLPSAPVPSH